MTVKTLFDPASGRILGAQIVGFDGVDKRMDVLAAAIRAGLTAEQLTELDLAYAPPYGSAKDPVNMAGYVIENVRAGLVEQHHWDAVAELPADGSVILLDVRTPGEVRKQGLLRSDALHIPLDELRGRLGELDKGKKIYVNCYSGLRSYLACRILSQHGFRCSNLSGGWRFWSYNATDRAHDAAPTHPVRRPHWKGFKKFRTSFALESSLVFICYWSEQPPLQGERQQAACQIGQQIPRVAHGGGLIQQGGQLQKEAAGQQIPGGGRNGAYGGTAAPEREEAPPGPAAGPRPEGR